jgi:arsenite/tail-anchored protein-transporting ATPase
MIILFFTGKGGVGKTTTAAATALAIAERGRRVLVVSSDAAHSLGDCLQVPLNGQPRQLAENLFAMEVDARAEMQQRFGEVRENMLKNMQQAGLEPTLAAEMIEFPGAEELFAMLRVAEIREARSFDAVVLDCAPTGNTLRFLNFSEFLSPIQRALRLERTVNRLTAPLSRLTGRTGVKDSYYATIFNTFTQIEQARLQFLTEETRFRVVLNPERLAILESQRAVSFLNVAGFFVDALVVNRILASEVQDPFFAEWKRKHQGYVVEIRDHFHPIRILEAPLRSREISGLEDLGELAKLIYGDLDPALPLTSERPFEIEVQGKRSWLRVRIPRLDRGELALDQSSDGLRVRIGPWERRIALPSAVTNHEVASAKYDETFLTIEFLAA